MSKKNKQSKIVLEIDFFKRKMRRQSFFSAGIAQLVEHFTCNEDVTGSTPVAGSIHVLDHAMRMYCMVFTCYKNDFEERFQSG